MKIFDGKKAYIGAAGSIFGGLGMIANGFVIIIDGGDNGMDQVMRGWEMVTLGLGAWGIRHAVKKGG